MLQGWATPVTCSHTLAGAHSQRSLSSPLVNFHSDNETMIQFTRDLIACQWPEVHEAAAAEFEDAVSLLLPTTNPAHKPFCQTPRRVHLRGAQGQERQVHVANTAVT